MGLGDLKLDERLEEISLSLHLDKVPTEIRLGGSNGPVIVLIGGGGQVPF